MVTHTVCSVDPQGPKKTPQIEWKKKVLLFLQPNNEFGGEEANRFSLAIDYSRNGTKRSYTLTLVLVPCLLLSCQEEESKMHPPREPILIQLQKRNGCKTVLWPPLSPPVQHTGITTTITSISIRLLWPWVRVSPRSGRIPSLLFCFSCRLCVDKK